jgi:hypothetical protein
MDSTEPGKGSWLNMKVKEGEKEIAEHRPKRELVDGAIASLKAAKQIPNDYTLPYEDVCSYLADCRLQIYREEGRLVRPYSYEYLYLLYMVVEMEYYFRSDDVEKQRNDFMVYYKGLSVEQKQKVDGDILPLYTNYNTPLKKAWLAYKISNKNNVERKQYCAAVIQKLEREQVYIFVSNSFIKQDDNLSDVFLNERPEK